MSSIQESLAAWATILGTVLSVVGLIQSREWLIVLSVVIFLVGLVSEQISSLRFEGRRP